MTGETDLGLEDPQHANNSQTGPAGLPLLDIHRHSETSMSKKPHIK